MVLGNSRSMFLYEIIILTSETHVVLEQTVLRSPDQWKSPDFHRDGAVLRGAFFFLSSWSQDTYSERQCDFAGLEDVLYPRR